MVKASQVRLPELLPRLTPARPRAREAGAYEPRQDREDSGGEFATAATDRLEFRIGSLPCAGVRTAFP